MELNLVEAQSYKEDICENINNFFEITGFTKTEIAKELNMPREQLSRAANSQTHLFSLGYLEKLENRLYNLTQKQATHKDSTGDLWMYKDEIFYKQGEYTLWVEYETTDVLPYAEIVNQYDLEPLDTIDYNNILSVKITFTADNPLFENHNRINVIDKRLTYEVELDVYNYADLEDELNALIECDSFENHFDNIKILNIENIKS